ncbi:hypothetical protein [Mycetocola sp. 2940]|uniref:hypothetical protein n=1 Tax=Mycetocola sp. 2940 TaxID=3156452 RepID=UPI0033954270
MSKKPAEFAAVGGVPRADLLPLEIRREHKGRKTRTNLLWGVVAVVVLVFIGTGASYYFAFTSQLSLLAAQNRTNELLIEQQKYSEVRVVQDELADVEAAQKVGAGTEIDWKAYIDRVEASLPGGAVLGNVEVEGASPLIDYAQPSAPLQGLRVATLTFSATTETLPDTDAWLVALADLPGFTDANPDSVAIDEETGTYLTLVTMHIGEDAWSERFVPEDEKTEAEPEEEDDAVPTKEVD